MFIIGIITLILSIAIVTSIIVYTSKEESSDTLTLDTKDNLLKASEEIVE